MAIDIDKTQFMKKYIANIITSSRIIFSLPLLFIPLSLSLTFVEANYSVATICLLATLAVAQEVYFIAKGQEILS